MPAQPGRRVCDVGYFYGDCVQATGVICFSCETAYPMWRRFTGHDVLLQRRMAAAYASTRRSRAAPPRGQDRTPMRAALLTEHMVAVRVAELPEQLPCYPVLGMPLSPAMAELMVHTLRRLVREHVPGRRLRQPLLLTNKA